MSWVKLDDQFFAHPKIVNLDKDAKLLYLAGLTYCAAQLTDGLISAGGLRIVLAMVDAPRRAVMALATAGLWAGVGDGGYQVHDYLQYNPSAEQVKKERAATARRQNTWRETRQEAHTPVHDATNGVSNAGNNGVTNPVTNGANNATVTPLVTGAPSPSPSRPKDSIPKESTNPRSTAPAAPACEDPRTPDKQETTIPVDNFTPFAARCWTAYPPRNGKKLHKADFLRRLKAIPSRDWDDVEVAIGHYAGSAQVLRGFAEDPHRFLTHWQDWIEPETPEHEGGPHAANKQSYAARERANGDAGAAIIAQLYADACGDPGAEAPPGGDGGADPAYPLVQQPARPRLQVLDGQSRRVG